MSIVLGSNNLALRVQGRLFQAGGDLRTSFERLSSGLRINKASDDAAGLAIAESLNADSRIYGAAVRNANDAISALSIAEGAYSQLSNITIRIMELAEQSANGVYSNSQREKLDAEAQALRDEFGRIAQTTEFNGLSLLDSSLSEINVQIGINGSENSRLGIALGAGATRAQGTGEFETATFDTLTGGNPQQLKILDINGDGFNDMTVASVDNNQLEIYLADGNGNFNLSSTIASTGAAFIEAEDFNNDGNLDFAVSQGGNGVSTISVSLGNGDGTFQGATTYSGGQRTRGFSSGDVNNDGALDLVIGAENDNEVRVLLGNGDGTFQSEKGFAANHAGELEMADFDGDGNLDIAVAQRSQKAFSVLLGNGDGTYQASTRISTGGNDVRGVNVGDYDGDGDVDIAVTALADDQVEIFTNDGSGSFVAGANISTTNAPVHLQSTDFNEDGFLDFVIGNSSGDGIDVALGNGDGTFQAVDNYATKNLAVYPAVGDLNNDGVDDIAVASVTDDVVNILLQKTTDVGGMKRFSLATRQDAKLALDQARALLSEISQDVGTIGAGKSRLETAINNNLVSRENTENARSRIMDVDVAVEAAKLSRNQIIQQAAASILAQVSQQPAIALQLLS